jgi:uncharacterized protein involved in response to NO
MRIWPFSPQPADRGGGPWRLLSSEPHRMMFFCGALQAVAAVAWWMLDLGGRYLGLYTPFAWSVPPMWAHAWLLLYGLFPFFMFGFLMTAGPNWLGAPPMPRAAFVPAAIMMACGLLVFYAGLAIGIGLAAAGVYLHAAGWLWGFAALGRMLARHWNANARPVIVVFAFFLLGLVGDALFATAIATGDYALLAPLLHGAVWFFLLPVFVAVGLRMVPFFSERVLGTEVGFRPVWARPVLLGGILLHGLLESSGFVQWLWLVDLPFAAAIAYLAWRWGLRRSSRVRLLAVLHWSLAVLAAAFLLSGVLSLGAAAGALDRVNLTAALHLLVIGFFAAMTLGMVSRVTLGHLGRPLVADGVTWSCYLGVLAAGLLRVLAELPLAASARSYLLVAAGLVWLAAFGVWAWRYVPMYLMPRVDARP